MQTVGYPAGNSLLSGTITTQPVQPLGENQALNSKTPVRQDNATGVFYGAGDRQTGTRWQRGPSQLKRGFPILRCPDKLASLPGLGAGGGGGAAPTYRIVTRNGRRALEITYQPHTNPQTVFWSIANRQYGDRLSVVLEVEDAAQWNGGFWGFQYSKDGSFADNARFTYNVGRSTGWSGTHCLSPVPGEFTFTGLMTGFAGNLTNIAATYASFRATRSAAPSGMTRIWLYEVVENEKQSSPQILLGADDGHMTWYNEGLPILEKYGFSSYLAYIRDGQDGSTRMRDAVEWADAVARGHHPIVHGCKNGINSLADYFASYTGYRSPYEAILADILYNQAGMVNAGLDPTGRGRRIYALPQGIHQPAASAGNSTIIDAVRAAGIVAARRATVEGSILMTGGQAGQAMYTPIIGHSYAGGGEAANIAALVTTMQTEIAAGRSVVLLFHEVRAAPTVPEQITAANLETLVAAAAALVQSGAARAGNYYDMVDEMLSYQSPVHMLGELGA